MVNCNKSLPDNTLQYGEDGRKKLNEYVNPNTIKTVPNYDNLCWIGTAPWCDVKYDECPDGKTFAGYQDKYFGDPNKGAITQIGKGDMSDCITGKHVLCGTLISTGNFACPGNEFLGIKGVAGTVGINDKANNTVNCTYQDNAIQSGDQITKLQNLVTAGHFNAQVANHLIKNYCFTNPQNLSAPECKKFCTDNIDACSSTLKTYCADKETSSSVVDKEICGCYYPESIYDDFYNVITGNGELSGVITKDKTCFYPKCASSEFKPQISDKQSCQDVQACVQKINIDNKGKIVGGIKILTECINKHNADSKKKKNDTSSSAGMIFSPPNIIIGVTILLIIIIIFYFFK
jgi:hypothetical protein